MLLDIPFQSAFFFPFFTLIQSQRGLVWKSLWKILVSLLLSFFRFSFFHSQRVKAQLSRDQFTEKFPSFSLAEIFAQLDFFKHWVLLKASWHGRFLASVHDIHLELLLAKLSSTLFYCPWTTPFDTLPKKLSLEAWTVCVQTRDRPNRATASEKLKMMWNFPSAFSRVPNRHSQRMLSNFPHAHTTSSASSYFAIINKSMSSHETRWKYAKIECANSVLYLCFSPVSIVFSPLT